MSCGCPLTDCLHPGTAVCEVDKLRRYHEQHRREIPQIPVVTRLREQQQQQRTMLRVDEGDLDRENSLADLELGK